MNPANEAVDQKRPSNAADAKFLRESNKLEVPTREDGSVQHNVSSESRFEESWPSTDRNVSSQSQITSSSSFSRPVDNEKENHSLNMNVKDIHEDGLSQPSTLSKYVIAFRISLWLCRLPSMINEMFGHAML